MKHAGMRGGGVRMEVMVCVAIRVVRGEGVRGGDGGSG